MNDLEQRLADELDLVAHDVRAPHVDPTGLQRVGRREQVRRRSIAGLAAAVVTVAVTAAGTSLAGGGDRAVDPATQPPGDHLARPLSLAWWASVDDQDDPGAGALHVDGTVVPSAAVQVVRSQDRTLVADRTPDGGTRWSVVEGGTLVPLTIAPLTGPPVADGATTVWVEDLGSAGSSVVRRTEEGRTDAQPADEGLVLVGALTDGRLLMTAGDDVVVRDLAREQTVPVTGLPGATTAEDVTARPGGMAVLRGETLVVGVIDENGAFRRSWSALGTSGGMWSDDGEAHAGVSGTGGVRATTEDSVTGMLTDETDLQVVGWESDREVVVAEWIEADGAVTRVWRCDVREVRCADVAGAPNGRALLPGLS